jgi:hypothetical protein
MSSNNTERWQASIQIARLLRTRPYRRLSQWVIAGRAAPYRSSRQQSPITASSECPCNSNVSARVSWRIGDRVDTALLQVKARPNERLDCLTDMKRHA